MISENQQRDATQSWKSKKKLQTFLNATENGKKIEQFISSYEIQFYRKYLTLATSETRYMKWIASMAIKSVREIDCII